MLFQPSQTGAVDEDGNRLVLHDHPPPYVPGAYEQPEFTENIPSLVSLCILALVPFPEEVHQLPVRLNLRPSLRVLHDLIPDPAAVDPRLWAVLIQVFDVLPPFFAAYTAPLADIHLPLLQAIPSSESFSLVTVLDLPACGHLTDDTILLLKFLRTLTAFDASQTILTAYGVKSLAATLQMEDHRGPWPLRLLSLRNCIKVTNDVYTHLEKFPLLSVVDLRGTRCTPNPSSTFHQCDYDELFWPSTTIDALTALHTLQPNLYSSSNSYILHINALHHIPTHRPTRTRSAAAPDAFVVIPSDNNASIRIGNSRTVERQTREREEAAAHERNKDAWYQRQDLLDTKAYIKEDRSRRHQLEKGSNPQQQNTSKPTGTRPMSMNTSSSVGGSRPKNPLPRDRASTSTSRSNINSGPTSARQNNLSLTHSGHLPTPVASASSSSNGTGPTPGITNTDSNHTNGNVNNRSVSTGTGTVSARASASSSRQPTAGKPTRNPTAAASAHTPGAAPPALHASRDAGQTATLVPEQQQQVAPPPVARPRTILDLDIAAEADALDLSRGAPAALGRPLASDINAAATTNPTPPAAPKPPPEHTQSTRVARRASYESTLSTHTQKLRLLRTPHPPPYASLHTHISALEASERDAREVRVIERARRAVAAAAGGVGVGGVITTAASGELAQVDMKSEKAEKARRGLEEVVKRYASHAHARGSYAKPNLSSDLGLGLGTEGHGYSDEITPSPSSTPMDMSTGERGARAKAEVKPLPLPLPRSSRNPFRRRPLSLSVFDQGRTSTSTAVDSDKPMKPPPPPPPPPPPLLPRPLASLKPKPTVLSSSSKSDFGTHATMAKPHSRTSSSSSSLLTPKPKSVNAQSQPQPQPKLRPISAVMVPELPAELRRQSSGGGNSESGSASRKKMRMSEPTPTPSSVSMAKPMSKQQPQSKATNKAKARMSMANSNSNSESKGAKKQSDLSSWCLSSSSKA